MPSKTDNITNLPDIKGTPQMTETDIMRLVDQYITNVINSGTNPPHAGRLIHFFELVQNVIWSRQAEERIPEDKRLLVMADDPPDEQEIDTEAVTFYMQERESGAFGRTAPGQSRGSVVKEAVHHVRSSQQHPEHLSEKLITMGRFFDNVVTFNIYARSDFQALTRLLWFEDVMDSFRWYFNLHRIKISELSASRKGKVSVGQLKLSKYSVSYFVRTEDTYQFGSQELKQIAIDLDVSKTKEE